MVICICVKLSHHAALVIVIIRKVWIYLTTVYLIGRAVILHETKLYGHESWHFLVSVYFLAQFVFIHYDYNEKRLKNY